MESFGGRKSTPQTFRKIHNPKPVTTVGWIFYSELNRVHPLYLIKRGDGGQVNQGVLHLNEKPIFIGSLLPNPKITQMAYILYR